MEGPLVNYRAYKPYTLVGPTWHSPVLDPPAEQAPQQPTTDDNWASFHHLNNIVVRYSRHPVTEW